ncbi:MAG: TonB-dependent receptor [Flavobacteriaceae bacterium]
MKKLFAFFALFSTVAIAQQNEQSEQEKDSLLQVVLNEVTVGAGIIDRAADRATPIAVSVITNREIERKGGQFDLIEVMRQTPSVQVNRGAGFGDGKMYLRGFDQVNTAFLINGQPINGVEDGKMYWSNWSGMIDVAQEVEIQRGLGSSKLAVSSVGGTVNIITKTIDQQAGGFVKTTAGQNNYLKTSAYLSTGLMDNGFAFSMLFGHWRGDGYHMGATGQGQTYFFSAGYKPNDNNVFNLFITGAPQWHGAQGGRTIADYREKGREWGNWYGVRDGEIYPGGRNFYHKPIYNLSWDWRINDDASLSTVIYGSNGRGGFAYQEGDFVYTEGGNVNYDAIRAQNLSGEGEGIVKASVNSHNWYGGIVNFSSKINDKLSYNVGIDGRMYNGMHFRAPTDLLGLSSYRGATETYGFNPWKSLKIPSDRSNLAISYNYEEDINYIGGFAQFEYVTDNYSAFISGTLSSQSHQTEGFMNYTGKGEKINNDGYNFKIGYSRRVGSNSKIYGNYGFYSRQPFHDDLYDNNRYDDKLNVAGNINQEISGLELGYQYEKDNFRLIVDLYSTKWDNRILSSTEYDSDTNELLSFSQSNPISQLHQGIEIQFDYKPTADIALKGFASFGDWVYDSNVQSRDFNEEGVVTSSGNISYLKGVKVGDAAQTSAGLEMYYRVSDRVSFNFTSTYYNDLYSRVNFSSGVFDTPDNQGTIKLPAFTLIDFSVNFKIPLSEFNNLDARLSAFNLFDIWYIEEMTTNNLPDSDSVLYKGIDPSNRIDPGYGRNFAINLAYRF